MVRAPSLLPNKDDCEKEQWYHVEFTIDASVPCTARIHYLIKETPKGNLVPSSNNSTKSDQLEFEAGMNQQFCMLTHRTCPEKILATDHIANHAESGEGKFLTTTFGSSNRFLNLMLGWSWTNIPVVIQLKTKCGRQTQLTYCTFEKNTQSNYVMKIIKQRVRVGRFNFSLQEIYGIEQKVLTACSQMILLLEVEYDIQYFLRPTEKSLKQNVRSVGMIHEILLFCHVAI